MHPSQGFSIEWDERGGASVVLDGHPQSYVDLDDPQLLVFEYVQHLALLLGLRPDGPLRCTHVGGAGLTLPRWVDRTRPGSPQIVLEPDDALTELVRRELPLPRGHRIRVRPVEGVRGMTAIKDASADVVILDAYAGGRVPAELVTQAFLADCARALAPGGVLLLNLADEPGLRWVARVMATIQAVGQLPHTAVVALREVLNGRRYGNVVLAASGAALDEAGIARAVARADFPTGMRTGRECARMAAGARPFGENGQASPPPPAPGQWRA